MGEFNYAAYDHTSATDQLNTKLAGTGAWKDRRLSATGRQLINLLAWVIDADGYKIERVAQERYKRFALLRSSVVELAVNLGYTPRRKVSSVTTLRFRTSTPPVAIPIGLVCSSTGGVQFVTTQQGTITGSYIDLTAKQGIPSELEFTSDGLANQLYTIPSSDDDVEAVENDSILVEVGSQEYDPVTSFVGQDAAATVCTITRKGSSILVKFGDDKNGKIPPLGETVRISWLQSLGSAGNVAAVDAINSIVTSGYSDVTVENTEAAQGGEDEEETEEIRENMSTVFATGNRAVTTSDFRTLLLAYPGIAKANAYGEQEVLMGATNPDYAWRIELVIVPTGGGLLTRTQEDLIDAYLSELKVACTYITFKDPTYVYVDFVVRGRVSDATPLDEAETGVKNALDDLVNFTDVDLGEALRYGDVVASVEAVEGMLSSIIEVFATKDAGTGDVAKTTFASTDSGIGNLNLLPIDRGNVSIYIEEIATGTRRRVGYDDGAGNLTSLSLVASPRVTSGTVNYTDGSFSIGFNAAVTAAYRVIVRYQTGSPKSQQIGVGDGIDTTFTSVLERNLSPNFVQILIDGTVVGYDDGAGTFVDAGGGIVSGGTVNYETGDIQVQFTTAPADDSNITSDYYYENQDLAPGIDQMILMGKKEITLDSVSD